MNITSLVTQLAIGLCMVIASFLFGCSALPVSTQTPVVNVTCNWTAEGGLAPASDGAANSSGGAEAVGSVFINDADCMVERATSGGEQSATGNKIHAPVDADVSADVAAP